MRITQQMIHQSSVRNMNQNLSRLEKLNQEVATGKKLHRPSDDPNGVSKAIQLKSAMVSNEQYERNTNEASLWLDETDSSISQMVSVMQRVRELAVQGSNDTLTDSDRAVLVEEVKELTEQMRNFANGRVNGQYLFNGQKTNQAPYPKQDSYLTNSFDTGAKTFAIGDGIVIQANVTADELFGEADDVTNLFASLNRLAEGIQGNGNGEIAIDEIDAGIERLINTQAQAGARKNRVDAVANRIQDSHIELQSFLSKLENVDYAEAVMKLKSEESIYQASLSVSAKIIQPSLMDFLR